MFPLPNYITYNENEESDNFLKRLFKPRSSHFIKIEDTTLYKTWNGEALINFKWDTFGRKYYYIIWMVYLIFSGSFIIVATFSDDISWPCQKILLITTTVLGFWYLFVEIRDITSSFKVYIETSWNYLDLGAIISAIVTSITWLINGSVPIGAITFTALLLELKFINYLRFIKYFGYYLAMILNTADQVVAFILLIGLIILAFAHSLHLLLQSEIIQPDSGVNMFTQLSSSIVAAYYMMITGDSTPVSSFVSNDDILIMGLMISLLDKPEDNNQAYLKLLKEILEEIELSYLLPSQKKNYKWFPYTFYYSVHVNELRKFISKINSDDWEESTKPILTKITKVMNDEKQESEADKIKKIYENQELEADKIQKIYEKQESEADKIQKIQKMLEKVMKKLEIQFSDEDDDQH
ncbi:nudt9 protein [Gigaspora margarita]|uniref:Nudt9 protein n=1 Tax=Gigaspora margarita TaxID=4874 RepID=A0A8H4A4Z8_GIGMA|nr:nudt9 protein [Gigaspora margarita]